MAKEKLSEACAKLPLLIIMRQKNAFVEPLIKDATIPAISDKGQPPPLVFKQAENTVSYALSSQNRYDEEVHQKLHGKDKESKIYDEIEIKTSVSNFKLPNRRSKESILLKEQIGKCNRKDVFRTSLIQHYIHEDW